MKLRYEMTDTFGGESNYSWVKRGEIENPSSSHRGLITQVKSILGVSGMRHRKEDYGDMIKLDLNPAGYCAVIFITWEV